MKTLSPIPKNSLKVGIVQMCSVDDVQTNLQSVLDALEKLRGQSCDLICLPENTLFLRLNGTAISTFNLKEDFWRVFQQFAKVEKCVLMIGSVAIKRGKKNANATVIVEPGKKPKVVYEKIHLFDVDVKGAPPARESDFFNSGKSPKMLKLKGWNIGLSICYDLRFSELYSIYTKKNVHLILVPAAFLVPTGQAHWHTLLRSRAIEAQAYVVAAAQSGGHRNLSGVKRETYGHSLVVGPWGDVKVDMKDGIAIQTCILDPKELEKTRTQIPMAHHRKL